MAGLDKPTSGTVWIGDQDLTHLKDKDLTEIRRDRVGFVFQAYNLVPTLTATLPRWLRSNPTPHNFAASARVPAERGRDTAR